MRDAVLALILVLVLTVAFSLYGPRDTGNDGFGGPGLKRLGETGLIVPGSGTVVITTAVETTPVETAPVPEIIQATIPAADEEETTMENTTELIWYAVGVATVLIGEFAGVVVAGAWHRLRREHKEE